MKKILMATLLTLFLVACSNTKNSDINILVPNGTPFIAIGGLIGEEDIIIEAVSGPDLLVSGLISKSHDIIIAPINLGAKVYASGSINYQLDSIITYGSNYIVSRKKDELNHISDLHEKALMAYGRGSIPDIILRKALSINHTYVDITYQNGMDQIIPFFVSNPDDPNYVTDSTPQYILCAEPIISKLEIEYQMDLNIYPLQDNIFSYIKSIPQAAIFVNKESNKIKDINKTLIKIEENILYLNNDPENYSDKIVNLHQYFKNLKANIIAQSIPRSNIGFDKAIENQDYINSFFSILNDYNPELIGNKIPDKDFYRQ